MQSLLENAVAHVLIILDCCYAANAARNSVRSETPMEILAASARENRTIGVSYRSFTSVLIDELKAIEKQPFTVSLLYKNLITERGRLVCTPVHASLSDQSQPSITIAPLHVPLTSTTDKSLEANNERPGEPRVVSEDLDFTPGTSTSTLVETRVLISVAVDERSPLNAHEWATWLSRLSPQAVTDAVIRIEGVFKSQSTLLLVSSPVPVWNLLPDRQAYCFVGFVKSKNLLEHQQSFLQGAPEKVANVHKSPVLFWHSDGSPESSKFADKTSKGLKQRLEDRRSIAHIRQAST